MKPQTPNWILYSALAFFLCFGAWGALLWKKEGSGTSRSSSSESNPVMAANSSPGEGATSADGQNRAIIDLQNPTGVTQKVDREQRAILNDPHIKEDWGKSKVQAEKAWAITQGSREIVVAVIDTGCDINHEDLKNNFWTNPGERGTDARGRDKASNKVDDDNNGFVDDVHGWNFVSNNNDLTDNHGHGTHIAGVLGAEAGNGRGIAGVAPLVSIQCLKYFDPKVARTDNLKNTIRAIRYAVQMGAQIINYSGGGIDASSEEKAAVEEARKAGVLFVAAAGNEKSNSDKVKYYPADYGLSNIISVTAIDPSTTILPSSNWGVETVDLAAPGQNIFSTLPGNKYGHMTGTSQATAFVSGAAVLIKSQRPNFSMDEVKRYILETGTVNRQLVGKARTYRFLNLFNALVMKDGNLNLGGNPMSNPQTLRERFSATDTSTATITGFGQDLMKHIAEQDRKQLAEEKKPKRRSPAPPSRVPPDRQASDPKVP